MEGYPIYENSTTCTTTDYYAPYGDITKQSTEEILQNMGSLRCTTFHTMIEMKESLIQAMKDNLAESNLAESNLVESNPAESNPAESNQTYDPTDDQTDDPTDDPTDDQTEYIERVSDTFIEFMKQFNESRERLTLCENNMKLAIDENKHHIQTLTKFIDFIKDLTLEPGQSNPIIKEINQVNDTLRKQNKIELRKQEYVSEKKIYSKYLSILQLINQMNTGSTCSICLTDNVDTYFIPCGHTACSGCNQRNRSLKCPLCRKQIMKSKKLYFT